MTSGCLSRVSSATGAKRSATAWASAMSKVPGGRRDRGRPAESSADIPQRARCADTRVASWRSGVTSAAVRPCVSTASRRAMAIACASSPGVATSRASTPVSDRSAVLRSRQRLVRRGGSMALEMLRLRTARASCSLPQRHSATSSRVALISLSNRFRAYWG